jgi:antitoxin YefM
MATSFRENEELNMVDARRELTKLPERLESHPGTVAVTRRGKPVLAIMTWEDYETIIETLEVLSDEEAVAQLRKGIEDIKQGWTAPLEEVKARLGLK